MNNKIKNINIEKVLFFDIETVRKTENLEVYSEEYLSFQHKIRNKETDELHEQKDVIDLYNRKAPLYLTYNRIVCISVGFVNKGVVRIKHLIGEEQDIIKSFCEISEGFDYLSGANIIGFDLPVIVVNGSKYFDMSVLLKDSFNPSGKKSWDLKSLIDISDVFKGTHFVNVSLVEMCNHFNISSPKDDISGADVSRVFFQEGVERVAKYCDKDVFASINVFQAMRHEKVFDEVVYVDDVKSSKHPLTALYRAVDISEQIERYIRSSTNKMLKKDRLIVEDLLCKIYVNNKMFQADKPERKESKKKQIKELLK